MDLKNRPRHQSHRETADGYVRGVLATKLELDDVYADRLLPNRAKRIAQLNQQLGLQIALAKVESNLAIAEAFREWTSLGREGLDAAERPPTVLVALSSKQDEDES